MGCAQSKIENEEAVTRCKERKLLMKEAVTARNAFAAAHSAYAMALKNTGAALSDYSHGEFLVSGNHSSSSGAAAVASTSSLPSALSPPSSAAISNNAASSSSAASVAIPQPIPDTLPPPPPPLPDTLPPPPPPLQRAATMPEMNGRSGGGPSGNGLNGTIIEEDGTIDDDDDDSDMENRERLIRKSRSRGGSNRGARKVVEDHHQEEKAPPPPPANPKPTPLIRQHQQQQPFYDYFFPNVENMPGTTLEDTPQPQPQPQPTKAMPSRPHSPVTEDDEEDDEEEEEEEDGEDEEEKEEEEETVVERKPPMEEVNMDSEKASNFRGMQKNKGTGVAGERRGGRTSVTNLANVFNEIDDSFLKASESAHEVSKMLEATRLHYHSNFADNRGISFSSTRLRYHFYWLVS